jgi:hypothetical protein
MSRILDFSTPVWTDPNLPIGAQLSLSQVAEQVARLAYVAEVIHGLHPHAPTWTQANVLEQSRLRHLTQGWIASLYPPAEVVATRAALVDVTDALVSDGDLLPDEELTPVAEELIARVLVARDAELRAAFKMMHRQDGGR